MAKTLIGFSGQKDDYIVVEGEVRDVSDSLAPANHTASGLVELIQVPAKFETFKPVPVFVNRDRVAYIRTPTDQ
jgi:predicted heme/steroid binding protein